MMFPSMNACSGGSQNELNMQFSCNWPFVQLSTLCFCGIIQVQQVFRKDFHSPVVWPKPFFGGSWDFTGDDAPNEAL